LPLSLRMIQSTGELSNGNDRLSSTHKYCISTRGCGF
jgi:hypothetical protein